VLHKSELIWGCGIGVTEKKWNMEKDDEQNLPSQPLKGYKEKE